MVCVYCDRAAWREKAHAANEIADRAIRLNEKYDAIINKLIRGE